MGLNAKSKLKMYIFSLMAFILVLFSVIVIIAIKGLNDTRANASLTYDLTAKNYHLQSMRLSFERTRRLNSNLIVYAGDLERIDYIRAEILSNIETFHSALSAFTDIDLLYQSRTQELDMIESISSLTASYNDILRSMTELATDGNMEAMNAFLLETVPLVSEISERLQEMSDYVQAQLDELAAYSDYGGNKAVMALISASVAAFIMMILVSVAVLLAMTRALTSLSNGNDLDMATNRQEPYKSGYAKGDDHLLLLPELERCISELKAVTYDLSKSAKDLKK